MCLDFSIYWYACEEEERPWDRFMTYHSYPEDMGGSWPCKGCITKADAIRRIHSDYPRRQAESFLEEMAEYA